MNAWDPLVFGLFPLVVLGLLGGGWWRTRKRTRSAKSEAASQGIDAYTQVGGARLDSFNATIPFASIVVMPSSIILIVVGREYRFERPTLSSLFHHRELCSTGLRIEHELPGIPSFIVFWTTNFESLREALERFGDVVAPPPRQ